MDVSKSIHVYINISIYIHLCFHLFIYLLHTYMIRIFTRVVCRHEMILNDMK